MSLATTYQVVHRQTVNGQICENVYFYDHVAGSGNSDQLGEIFRDELIEAIRTIQVATVLNTRLSVINLGVTTDFSEFVLTNAGLLSGQMLSPQDAYSYTFRSGDRAIRPGGKRFVGVSEDSQAAGVISEPSTLAAMEIVRGLLGINLILGSDTFHPILVKRVKIPIVGTVPPKANYRLPRTEAEYLATDILAVLSKNTVSSQVSRKIK